MATDKGLITLRLSVENSKEILKELKKEVRDSKPKRSRNKCIEDILLGYFKSKKSDANT